MKEEELNELKYRQLQKLAKDHGIKANLPRNAIIEALIEATEKNSEKTEDLTSENVQNVSMEKPASRRGSRKKNSIVQESTEEVDSKPAFRRNSAKKDSLLEISDSKPSSRRGSAKKKDSSIVEVPTKKKSIEVVDLDDSKNASTNSRPGSRRGSKRKQESKSFDQDSLDAEISAVEKIAKRLIERPAKRSRNSSSMLRATSQQDNSTNIELNSSKLNNSILNNSLQTSRRNSRISRLFDKEAFDIEAAKVSRFAERIVNSPRKRSSILNLTPIMKGQSTGSAISSPLVQPTPNTNKTPLQKRPSMSSKTTEIKKKKTVTMKAVTPKAKNTCTGIPRPRKVPNFAKMHAKQFGKMDTLDQYLDKKEKRIAALTPGPQNKVKSALSPTKKNLVTDVVKANFNFSSAQKKTTEKKPFVFKARPAPASTNNKILDNITNKSSKSNVGYKPYTGKVKPLNAKETLKNRQQMANRNLGGNKVKEQQMNIIKGVRMNKRMELMMQKRNLNN